MGATGGFCPFCGWRRRPWLTVPGNWRRPDEHRRFKLWWCEGCLFGQVWPRPAAADAGDDVEERTAREGSVGFMSHGSAHEADVPDASATGEGDSDHGTEAETPGALLRLIQRAAKRFDEGEETLPPELDGATMEIADLGCGDGRRMRALLDRGHRVVGLEADPGAVRSLRGKGQEVHKGSAEDIPYEVRQRRFGAVLMMDTLGNAADPRLALRGALSLLAPGGWLIVETPNSQAAGLKRAGPGWLGLDVPRHLNFFTEHSLSLACKRAGLTVSRVAFGGYSDQFTRRWIETERTIRQRLGLRGPWIPSETVGAARLLLATALSGPTGRYASVRVVARSQEGKAGGSSVPGRRAHLSRERDTVPGRHSAGTSTKAGLWRPTRSARPSGRPNPQ